MADKVQITGIKMSDETELTFPALEYINTTSKGNLEISSPAVGQIKAGKGGKINLEAADSLAVKLGYNSSGKAGKVELDTTDYPEGKKDEFKVAVLSEISGNNYLEGLKIEAAGLKFESIGVDEANWTPGLFPLMFKQESGDVDTWSKVNIHGASFDLRTRTNGAGTGGGIALQIASCDGDWHENKLKVETSRKKDVFEGLPTGASDYSDFYVGEGGKGIEISTLNSQFESVYTAEMRRGAETEVFAVTRGDIAESGGKTDYPTQTDDSKDIKPDGVQSIVWRDIVNAAIYLKLAGKIPSDTDTASTFTPDAGQASDYVYKAQ